MRAYQSDKDRSLPVRRFTLCPNDLAGNRVVIAADFVDQNTNMVRIGINLTSENICNPFYNPVFYVLGTAFKHCDCDDRHISLFFLCIMIIVYHAPSKIQELDRKLICGLLKHSQRH